MKQLKNNRSYKIAVLPGDGIGPEVIAQTVRVLEELAKLSSFELDFHEALIGGAAFDATGKSLPTPTISLCKNSDAVLVGPVGGEKWDYLELDKKPEKALILLRKYMQCYANLRPVNQLTLNKKNTPLRQNLLVDGINFMIVRELSGGMYAGAKGRRGTTGAMDEIAFDMETYEASEIYKVADFAFSLARKRRRKLASLDKANVLETSRLWREVVSSVSKKYHDVQYENLYVDHAFTRMMSKPWSFDIILCNNIFGDIASDIAAGITGSYASLPSASLSGHGGPSLFEAVHGTAPDLVGLNKANPLGLILSSVLMLEYGLKELRAANVLRQAVEYTLEDGYRTADLLYEDEYEKRANEQVKKKKLKLVGTKEMSEAIISAVKKLHGKKL